MVASNEQGGWKVLCQNVQPGHVEEVRDAFTSNGHTPAGGGSILVYWTFLEHTALSFAPQCC